MLILNPGLEEMRKVIMIENAIRYQPQFDEAVEQFRQIVGNDHIVVDQSVLKDRCRDTTPRTKMASAFVYPANISELQQVVKIANTYRIPIWPVSQGRNWGYGASSPAQEGSVVVHLGRMNKIMEVNCDLAYAVIEPGVTFRQLHQYLVDRNLPLWIDCTDGPPDGSVMGNALDRGIGETDYGDHFGNICGLEVVLPQGDVIYTGGGPEIRSWHTYKWGMGPYTEGLFSQSSFGIVTKMGVWLRPKPEAFASCVFELRTAKDFPRLIDGLRQLQFSGALVSKVHLINQTATMSVVIEDFSCPESTLRGYKFAPWTFAAGVYGTHSQVKSHQREIRRVLGPLGRVEFVGHRKLAVIQAITHVLRRGQGNPIVKRLSDFFCKKVVGKPLTLLEIIPHVHAIEQGHPSDFFVRHAYLKSKAPKPTGVADPVRDQCGLVWLGPMVPLIGKEMDDLNRAVEPLFQKYGFDMYVAVMIANPRTAISLFSIFYDKTNTDETDRALKLYFEIAELTEKMGYQQYRTATLYMDKVLGMTPEFLNFCNRLKSAVDPNGILAPGKYGLK